MNQIVRNIVLLMVMALGAVTASAQAAVPFVRVTYMCQAPDAGSYNGIPVNAGDHVWRVRYESGNSDAGSPSPVSWSSNFLPGGSIASDETQLVITATGQNGVKIFTPSGNKYGGTASVSGSTCTLDPVIVAPPPGTPPHRTLRATVDAWGPRDHALPL